MKVKIDLLLTSFLKVPNIGELYTKHQLKKSINNNHTTTSNDTTLKPKIATTSTKKNESYICHNKISMKNKTSTKRKTINNRMVIIKKYHSNKNSTILLYDWVAMGDFF